MKSKTHFTSNVVNRRTLLATGAAGAAAMMSIGGAMAQDYPAKPITIVVPYSAGGSTDVMTRVLADKLTGLLANTVIVENRPGAGGTIGAASVARANPDGYTLLVAPSGTMTLAPLIAETKPFDPITDFTPVVPMQSRAIFLISRADGGYESLDQIRGAQRAGKRLTIGLSGNGNLTHYSAFFLGKQMGIDFVVVPYNGGAPLIAGIVSGEVDMGFLPFADAKSQIDSGTVRPLLVTSKDRSTVLPDVPSLSDEGLREPAIESWNGFYGPAGLPGDIVAKLGDAVAAVCDSGALDKFMPGSERLPGTPADLASYVARDIKKYQRFIDESGFLNNR